MKAFKMKTILITLLCFCFIGAIGTLFLPFLEKTKIKSGNLDLPNVVNGIEFRLTSIVLLFMSISILLILLKPAISSFWPIITTALTFGVTYLIRNSIHFQGFIDHDYDSTSGIGYYILVSIVVLFGVLVSIYLIKLNSKYKKHEVQS